MVVEVFVAQAEAEDALLEQVEQGVFDEVGVAVIGEAVGELLDEVELGFDLAEQQPAGIGGDGAAVKACHDVTRTEVLEKEIGRGTICHSVRAP